MSIPSREVSLLLTIADFGKPRGGLLGIMSAVLPLGCVVATPFVSMVGDRYGRRMGIFFGASVMLIGGAIQGASQNCKFALLDLARIDD